MSDKINNTKEYSNGEVTIIWNQGLCIHSGKCVNGLPAVFRPEERPWINPLGATSAEIIKQVNTCPSGALSIKAEKGVQLALNDVRNVEILKNGPLMVEGDICIKDHEGNLVHKNKKTFFCRCGSSNNKPFCDGAHKKAEFEG